MVKRNTMDDGFYVFACLILLYSHKEHWTLFWQAIQLLVHTFHPLESYFQVVLG